MVLEMNNVLEKAEVWLTALEIRTKAETNHLAVHRGDLATLGTESEILVEIKAGIGHQRIFWTDTDNEWINLESI
jgi:hypothetical protein